jgi:hypothetical protein
MRMQCQGSLIVTMSPGNRTATFPECKTGLAPAIDSQPGSRHEAVNRSNPLKIYAQGTRALDLLAQRVNNFSKTPCFVADALATVAPLGVSGGNQSRWCTAWRNRQHCFENSSAFAPFLSYKNLRARHEKTESSATDCLFP